MAKEWNSELLEDIEVDTDALLAACAERSDLPIMQDSYGDGVAQVGRETFATYHDLAAHFGLDAARFQRSCDAPR